MVHFFIHVPNKYVYIYARCLGDTSCSTCSSYGHTYVQDIFCAGATTVLEQMVDVVH